MKGYTDLGHLSMGEVRARVAAEPDVKFVLRISDKALEYLKSFQDFNADEADISDWPIDLLEFEMADDAVMPIDDWQRPLHLLRIDPTTRG